MTKEEILEKSRSDNAGKDIEDLEVQKTAARVAYFSSFGLCFLVSILNWIFTKQIKIECWIVFFGMVSCLEESVGQEQQHERKSGP